MEQMKKQLEAREKFLKQVKVEKEKALAAAPEGNLRICSSGNKTQYYHRQDPKDFNGEYIRGENKDLARKLAQKDYDRKILRSAEKELVAIGKYLSNYPKENAEQIYESLHKERQKLITPILEPKDQYVSKWTAVEYEGKAFDEEMPELYTSRGERVRSKSEVIIADLLSREAIPYRYECPIYLKGVGKVHPDFTALNVRLRKEIYWEHLGMMDDPAYVENALLKISAYEQNGIFPGDNLILTYESRKNLLNPKLIRAQIQQYLK